MRRPPPLCLEPLETRCLPVSSGLAGQVFLGEDFNSGPVATLADSAVDYDFVATPPPVVTPGAPFSVRWQGKIQPQFSQTYTFSTVSDDGVRLWVNDRLLIDDFTEHAATSDSGQITLSAGRNYDVRVDYFENGAGQALIRLFWQSPSQPREIVPAADLAQNTDPLSSLAGSVFSEANDDGRRQARERGLGGQTVTLTGTDAVGNAVLRTTTTAPDGSFSFAGLITGDYALSTGVPDGELRGTDHVGDAGGVDGPPGTIAGIALDGTDATGYDFGMVEPASLSGVVFLDAGGSGARGADEGGLGGVAVLLTGRDDRGAAVSLTTRTAADGSFSFTGLRPGTYDLTAAADGLLAGPATPGSGGGTAGTGEVTGIVLRPGETGRDYLFGEAPPAAVPAPASSSPPAELPSVAVSPTATTATTATLSTPALISASLFLEGASGGPAVALPALASAPAVTLPGTPAGPGAARPPAGAPAPLSSGGGAPSSEPTDGGTASTIRPVNATPDEPPVRVDASRPGSQSADHAADSDPPPPVPPRVTFAPRERLAAAFSGERLDDAAGADGPAPDEDAVSWALARRDDERRAGLDEPEDDLSELILFWFLLTTMMTAAPARWAAP
jgi:hypothetical protein